ncbi:MAG: ubiquinol-cytochrome c reductase iron-sulfur subunit [Chloroflexota bacterium]
MSNRDELDSALERLQAGESPREEAGRLSDEERLQLRTAQLLKGAGLHHPRPDFVAGLHHRLFPRPRVSRRDALLGGIGALAAGVAGGIGVDRYVRGGRTGPTRPPLVGSGGHWLAVATLADVPDGTVYPFETGALQGFLIHREGRIRALSRVCTHMGCRLNYEHDEKALVCPCHGAEFSLHGDVRYGPHGYGTPLPALPHIRMRIRRQSIEVWTV